MVLQLEDCIDILKAPHPGIDLIFLLYHTCQHDREREEMLNVKNMNSDYSGSKLQIQPTDSKQEVGCLDLHGKILEVGDEKYMVFQQGGNTPLWMTPQEREATKFCQYDEPKLKYKTKDKLLGNLKSYDVDIYVLKGKRLGQIEEVYYWMLHLPQ